MRSRFLRPKRLSAADDREPSLQWQFLRGVSHITHGETQIAFCAVVRLLCAWQFYSSVLALNLLPCFFHEMWIISGSSDLAWSHAHPCCVTSENLSVFFSVFTAGLAKMLYLPRSSVFLIHRYVGIFLISFFFFFHILSYCRLRSIRSQSFAQTTLEVQHGWSSKLKQRVPGGVLWQSPLKYRRGQTLPAINTAGPA